MSIYLKLLIGTLIFAAGSLPGVAVTQYKLYTYDKFAAELGCESTPELTEGVERVYVCPDGTVAIIL